MLAAGGIAKNFASITIAALFTLGMAGVFQSCRDAHQEEKKNDGISVSPQKAATVPKSESTTHPLSVSAHIWLEKAKLAEDAGVEGDEYGTSVSISGDTAVVWAPHAALPGTRVGTAYVYVRSGDAWTKQAELAPTDTNENRVIAPSAVSISADTVVMGAPGNGSGTGAAYVFVRSGTAWSQQATLVADDVAEGDWFGAGVSVDGDTAVIWSANAAHSGIYKTGAAYVFVRNGATWSQQAKLVADDAATNDKFGQPSISGDTIVIGAYWKDSAKGGVYVFARNGATWSQQAKLVPGDDTTGSEYGVSVSISGDTIVAGAPHIGGEGCGQESLGAAYVFVRDGTAWSQQARLMASDGQLGDMLGMGVSISGDRIVAGVPGRANLKGVAYVFERSGTTWNETPQLFAGDGVAGDWFGLSVSISGDVVLVGASSKASDTVTDKGAAYLFGRETVEFTSADNAAFTIGEAGSFTVTTSSTVEISLSSSGAIPAAVAFADQGDGTAVLSGTPEMGTAGQYNLVFSAIHDGITVVKQDFTLKVDKITAAVTLENLLQTYDGTPRTATATTVPAGLTVDITYDGSAAPPTNAGKYAVVGTINDVDYKGSDSKTLTIVRTDTATALVSSLNPSILGDEVTFTATVTAPSGTPSGEVAFKDGATLLGTRILSGGIAALSISSLSLGNHDIKAEYGGDENHADSASNVLTQTVNSVIVDGGAADTGADAGIDGGNEDSGGDAGAADAEVDAGSDAGIDAGEDAGVDSGADGGADASEADAEADAGADAGIDAGTEDSGVDAAVADAGTDAGADSGVDGGMDAEVDAGVDGAVPDSGVDASTVDGGKDAGNDASIATDAGTDGGRDGGGGEQAAGCSCSTVGDPDVSADAASGFITMLAGLMAVALISRRRN